MKSYRGAIPRGKPRKSRLDDEEDDFDDPDQTSRGVRDRQLLIAIVAALAVLVSGGVSALATYQSNENTLIAQNATLKAQEEANTRAFVRDSRKVAYTEFLDFLRDTSPLLEPLMREVGEVVNGDREGITQQTVDDLGAKLADVVLTITQIRLLGSKASQEAADVVLGDLWVIVEQAEAVLGYQDVKAPRDEIIRQMRALGYLIQETELGNHIEDVTERFREDLGVPSES